MEQVITSSIQRNIPGLKIFPIRKDGDNLKTIYVVQIPPSLEAPHICKDKKFYKRFNFSSVAMEEYEVRQLYGRKVKSILALSSYSISQLPKTKDFSEFECIGTIQNIGETIVDSYKLNVYLKNFPNKTTVFYKTEPQNSNHSFTHLDEKRFKVSAFSMCPIYPGEALDIILFNFKILDEFMNSAIENSSVEFILLYSNGEDRILVNLKYFINTPEILKQ